MASSTVRVTGYRETLASFKFFEKSAQTVVKKTLGMAALPVVRDTQSRLSRYRGASLSTIRPHVLMKGVVVRQDQRKRTGRHPEFGSIQMKALLGAAYEREDETVAAVEKALDRLADGVGF